MKGYKISKVLMKAPSGLTPKGVMKVPKLGGKMPTLKDLKVPKGGLSNKGLRASYGKVPGLV